MGVNIKVTMLEHLARDANFREMQKAEEIFAARREALRDLIPMIDGAALRREAVREIPLFLDGVIALREKENEKSDYFAELSRNPTFGMF